MIFDLCREETLFQIQCNKVFKAHLGFHEMIFIPNLQSMVLKKKIKDLIENNTWASGDMEIIFECSHRYRTNERSERVRYRV